ncbi:MAG: hypothetical protein IPJ71_16885 [Bdellovibrionales bacterium]|nr:hypothetical protein [Bdellovibrionales bacterium]
MAVRVKLADDGSSIDFSNFRYTSSSLKKFRRSPEIEGFYRFIYENDLRIETGDVLDRIIVRRSQERKSKRKKS